ncbi:MULTISPECIES: LysR family transcriptional regulator [unclassified Pannonibacter]|uniref:LysR family transcriptional regulator n=1 Tax=unclassified Pannonibacter TaxID=2627228 RepID=UPI001644E383|nr:MULTISPECIES: LysR family transcriptional regulator [unclassified Pannonibacter]
MKISGSDLHLLRVFECVVRNGGISAAQMELSLSQPTISNHLTALEQRIGVKLCERGRRGFSLTHEGRRVYEISVEMTGMLDAGSARLSCLRSALAGKVSVGVVDCLSTDPSLQMAGAIAAISRAAPEIELNLRIMRPNDITKAVASNEIDLGIGGSDIKVAGLTCRLLYREENALYCGVGHPLFALPGDAFTIADCYDYPWVHRGYWNGLRGQRFGDPVKHRVAYDIEAEMLLVLSGAYLGVLPVHYAQTFASQQRLRRLPLQEETYFADIELARRSGEQAANVNYVAEAILNAHGLHL